MPCGQSVFFLYYLSQQYYQNRVLCSVVVNGKWHMPEGLRIYRIGLSDSIKGLLRVLCILSEAGGEIMEDL